MPNEKNLLKRKRIDIGINTDEMTVKERYESYAKYYYRTFKESESSDFESESDKSSSEDDNESDSDTNESDNEENKKMDESSIDNESEDDISCDEDDSIKSESFNISDSDPGENTSGDEENENSNNNESENDISYDKDDSIKSKISNDDYESDESDHDANTREDEENKKKTEHSNDDKSEKDDYSAKGECIRTNLKRSTRMADGEEANSRSSISEIKIMPSQKKILKRKYNDSDGSEEKENKKKGKHSSANGSDSDNESSKVKKHKKPDSQKKIEISSLLKPGDTTATTRYTEHRCASDSSVLSNLRLHFPEENQKEPQFSASRASLTYSDALVRKKDNGVNKNPKKDTNHLKIDSQKKSEIYRSLKGFSEPTSLTSIGLQISEDNQSILSCSSTGACLTHTDAFVGKGNTASKIIHKIPTTDKMRHKKHYEKDFQGKPEINPSLKGSSELTSSSSIKRQFTGEFLTHSDALVTKEDNSGGKIIDQMPSESKNLNLSNASRKETYEIPLDERVYKSLVKDNGTANQDVFSISFQETRMRFDDIVLKDTRIKNTISKNKAGDTQAVTLNPSDVAESLNIRRKSNNGIGHQNIPLEEFPSRKEDTLKVSLNSEASPTPCTSGNEFHKFIEMDNIDSSLLTENRTGDNVVTNGASVSSSEIKVLDNVCVSQSSSIQELSEGELTFDETPEYLKSLVLNNSNVSCREDYIALRDYYNHLCNPENCFFFSTCSQSNASLIKKISLPENSSKPINQTNEKNNPFHIDFASEKKSEESVINECSSSRDCLSQEESNGSENNQFIQIPPEPENLQLKNEFTSTPEKLVMRELFKDMMKTIQDHAEVANENFETECRNAIWEFQTSVLKASNEGYVEKDLLHTALDMAHYMNGFVKKI